MPRLFKNTFDIFYDDRTGMFVNTLIENERYVTKMRVYRGDEFLTVCSSNSFYGALHNNSLWCSIAENTCRELKKTAVELGDESENTSYNTP